MQNCLRIVLGEVNNLVWFCRTLFVLNEVQNPVGWFCRTVFVLNLVRSKTLFGSAELSSYWMRSKTLLGYAELCSYWMRSKTLLGYARIVLALKKRSMGFVLLFPENWFIRDSFSLCSTSDGLKRHYHPLPVISLCPFVSVKMIAMWATTPFPVIFST